MSSPRDNEIVFPGHRILFIETNKTADVKSDAYDYIVEGRWFVRQRYLIRGCLARVLTLKLFGWKLMLGVVRDDPRWTLKPTTLPKGVR